MHSGLHAGSQGRIEAAVAREASKQRVAEPRVGAPRVETYCTNRKSLAELPAVYRKRRERKMAAEILRRMGLNQKTRFTHCVNRCCP